MPNQTLDTIKKAPFGSYRNATEYQSKEELSAQEATNVTHLLQTLPSSIHAITQEAANLPALIGQSDLQVTQSVINQLLSWVELPGDFSDTVYVAIGNAAHRLQFSQQAIDDQSLVNLLVILSQKVEQEIKTLGSVRSHAALKALQAATQLTDCLLIRGVSLGHENLQELQARITSLKKSLTRNCSSHPLHDFWGQYLLQELSLLTYELTPEEETVYKKKIAGRIGLAVGAGGVGLLHAGVGTASLALAIASIAAFGAGFEILPGAILGFLEGMYQLIKMPFEVAGHLRKAYEHWKTLHPDAVGLPENLAAYNIPENEFWQYLESGIDKMLGMEIDAFNIQLTLHALTEFVVQRYPAPNTVIAKLQKLLLKSYRIYDEHPNVQKFVLICYLLLQQKGYETQFPAQGWEDYGLLLSNDDYLSTDAALKKLIHNVNSAHDLVGEMPKETAAAQTIALQRAWFEHFNQDKKIYYLAKSLQERSANSTLDADAIPFMKQRLDKIATDVNEDNTSQWGRACLEEIKKIINPLAKEQQVKAATQSSKSAGSVNMYILAPGAELKKNASVVDSRVGYYVPPRDETRDAKVTEARAKVARGLLKAAHKTVAETGVGINMGIVATGAKMDEGSSISGCDVGILVEGNTRSHRRHSKHSGNPGSNSAALFSNGQPATGSASSGQQPGVAPPPLGATG